MNLDSGPIGTHSELQEKPGLKGKGIQIFHNVIITEQEGLGNYIDINILVPGSKDKVDKTLTYIYYIDERAYKAMIKFEGARESYTAMYDAKGKLLEMKKD